MTRRSFFLAIGCVLFLAGSVGTIVTLLLRYQPAHYRNAPLPEGEARVAGSQAFQSELSEFWSALKNNQSWFSKFTDEQVNSYLNHHFVQSGLAEKLLPDGISDPRITFEANRMWLCFRYRGGLINTVISVGLRIWLPSTETNVIAIQLDALNAGLVPFSAQWLLERISETARQNGVEVSWYRHQSYPVAVVRFQEEPGKPTPHVKGVQVEEGSVTIHLHSDGSQPAAPDASPALPRQEARR